MDDSASLLNVVVEALSDQLPFEGIARVLWVDESAAVATLITIAHTPRKPWVVSTGDLRIWLQRGDARRSQFRPPAYMLQVEEDIPAGERESRDRNWQRIAGLVDRAVSGEIFMGRSMGAFVAQHAEATGTQRKTLYRLLYRYWAFGQVRNALLPNYENVGAPGKARVFAAGKRPGRPPMHKGRSGERCGKILGDDDKEFIRIGYSLYRNNEVASVTDAYHRTLRRFYVDEHVVPGSSTDDLTLKPLEQLPSLRQFRYWGKKAFDDLAVQRSRMGERRWQKDHRGLTGRASDGVYGPCHRFEIDATIADIYLVSRYNRNWVVGRPVIYVVIDVFSTMIAGIFVALEGPSWNGARHALFNAFTDKVAFCRMYGIEIESSSWPAHHLPHELMADRGEMLGHAAEGIVSGLGIDIAIAPPFRPDWKAIVESRFRLLNSTSQIHWIPGAVRQRIAERGERDYRLDAVLDLAEFTNIMISSVLHYNHHSRRPDRLTADMIREEIEPSPVNLWRWGMENGLATPNTQSSDLVYLHLLPRDTASVQRGGICFKGMFYTCSYAVEQSWFARARKDGRRSVTVWYDPNDTTHVWLQDNERNFVRCDLLASEQRVAQRRLEEVLDMLQMTGTPADESTYAALNDRIRLDAHIGAIVAQAQSDKRATQPASPVPISRQVADIRKHRAFEKTAAQQGPVVTSPVAGSHKASPPAIGPTSSSVAAAYAGERGAEVLSLLGRLRNKGNKT
ncbi:Mu transposase C-terminal domain-containing protein [Paraburkholderia phymatum]|uniref:Tn7-like transposition protein B n=1 Tax=Paraburkholderia phymatum (strain DSM 17167 / CIP 108236 / LMG 21445 / STM815) TaxID=391038 RepID=B2JTX9_PARP8|nr:Mu transposase C-terminal domain-containing protein [Paraburkholderia phymatum]ACC76032.1 Tn7-like transposition protein B [Paraburkholderia phymatum STM815]